MARTDRTESVNSSASGGRRRKRNPLASLISGIGTLAMALAILICLIVTAPRVAGVKSYVVVSGSMEPAIPVGSLVYVREVEPKTLESGEIILFSDTLGGGIPVTHRVVENRTADGEIITKGDANAAEDIKPVRYDQVLGRVGLHIPGLGYIAAPLSSPKGKISMALFILAGFLLTEIGSRLGRGSRG